MDEFIRATVRKAGKSVLQKFRKTGIKYIKNREKTNVVTDADLISDRIIISAIRKRYPYYGILSEETGVKKERSLYQWIIDPLDGTLNFFRGIPIFAVMACLTFRARVILSCIYDPVSDELFFARRGKGAFLNQNRIYTSLCSTLDHSYGSFPARFQEGGLSSKLVQKFLSIPGITFWAGGFGSAGHSGILIASGRRDWYFSSGSSIWDYAPVSLLLEESGCKVTDIGGRPWKPGSNGIIAANPKLHKQLLHVLSF